MSMLLAFLAQTLRIAVPYLFAAAGGVLAERAGIISLTLEGFLLGGAFSAMLGSYYSGSPWIGVLSGIAGGLALGMLHAVSTIRFKADQVVSGIAINLLAVGLTRYFLKLVFDSSSNSPRVAGFAAGTSATALVAGLLHNPLIPLGLLIVPAVAWLLYRTPFGLRVRAVGEHPEAAVTLGISVKRVRYGAVALSGALAAIIFGRWDPMRAGLACLFFAAAETLQIQLQGMQAIPSQFVQMIPYVLTIVALVGVVGRAVPPAALGRE